MLGAYREGRLAHAWLIGGREGVGKATLAGASPASCSLIPIRTRPPCARRRTWRSRPIIPAARQLAALAHPDFALLRREWNPKSKAFFTDIRVDDIRAGLNMFHMSAAFGGWRVAIVDCADELNPNGANALLKVIEEPPPRSLILIVAHRPGQVLATIRSRCRRLLLERLSPAEIGDVVGGLGPPWDATDPKAREAAARRADGSVREALRRLDPEADGVGALIDATIAQLPNADPRAIHKLAEAVSGRAAADAFEALTVALYDWLAARARADVSPAARQAATTIWDKLRAATRETEALNLDRKLHVLAVFEEIAARARFL